MSRACCVGSAASFVWARDGRINTPRLNNRFICANPAGIQAPGECIVLGRECTSLLELESVAKDIRADLDRVIDDARKKLGNST